MSVQMNFSSNNEYELIEYPGLVKNIDKMISTLGGMNKISRVSCTQIYKFIRTKFYNKLCFQALGGENKRLELRYHPDNPFNKPLSGDSSKRTGLLLSIKVRKSKRNPSKPPLYTVKIMGYVTKSFTFECR